MIEIDGIRYFTAVEAARYLGINRCMFYNNVKSNLTTYKLGVRKRKHYKLSDLEKLNEVQLVAAAS